MTTPRFHDTFLKALTFTERQRDDVGLVMYNGDLWLWQLVAAMAADILAFPSPDLKKYIVITSCWKHKALLL